VSYIKMHWKLIVMIAAPVIACAVTITVLILAHTDSPTNIATQTSTSPATPTLADTTADAPAVSAEIVTQYGNKYASGLLPVGDGKYSTVSAAKGQVYLCHAPGGGGGASSRGPWFTNNNTQYDINKKAKVSGSIQWTGQYTMGIVSGKRVITTNDLPSTHTTGVFPIASSDAAYMYDRNPNSIKVQSLTYSLSASPVALAAPGCISGEVGIMTTGVALFNAFDAGAWEVQDSCGGHPQISGEYHYHTLSSCITDVSSKTVIGYALDGYPITGPTVSTDNIMTTSDLDECHGITSAIVLDGISVTMYHYVMTQDFPYSISCFKASASVAPGHN
jgi:YHYH protein